MDFWERFGEWRAYYWYEIGLGIAALCFTIAGMALIFTIAAWSK